MYYIVNNCIVNKLYVVLDLFVKGMRKLIRRFLDNKDYQFKVEVAGLILEFMLSQSELKILLTTEEKMSAQLLRNTVFALYKIAYFFFVYVDVTHIEHSKKKVLYKFELLKNNGSYKHLNHSLSDLNLRKVKTEIEKKNKRRRVGKKKDEKLQQLSKST